MTPAQVCEAKTMIGKMSREEIAQNLGVSLVSLKRAFRGTRLAYYNYCQARPNLVKAVNKYFEKHNQTETAIHFGLSRKQVDHIIYRYRTAKPKQIRWTDSQIADAARMGGLVSAKAQAKYFNRPGANAGSIKSLWTKRLTGSNSNLNGMVRWHARRLVQGHKARYIQPYGDSSTGRRVKFRKIILWVDMEKCLRPDIPLFVHDAIKTMANFQRWLHGSKDPKKKILAMIARREPGRIEHARESGGE